MTLLAFHMSDDLHTQFKMMCSAKKITMKSQMERMIADKVNEEKKTPQKNLKDYLPFTEPFNIMCPKEKMVEYVTRNMLDMDGKIRPESVPVATSIWDWAACMARAGIKMPRDDFDTISRFLDRMSMNSNPF